MIALFQSFETKFIQVFPGCETIRYIESRQLGYTEFNLYMTSLSNLMSVLQSFQSIWEKLCHFFRGFHIILPTFIPHSILICKFLVSLQTEKDIVRCSILCHCVMYVVGCYQVNSCFFVHTQKFLINYLLCRNSVIL